MAALWRTWKWCWTSTNELWTQDTLWYAWMSHQSSSLPRPRLQFQHRRVNCEPLAGKRMVKITERKTKQDWAVFLEEIASHYLDAKKITLVMDNLNTHGPGSLYETFSPDQAKALWDRFEFVYTPKHGSWLNMAEIELNVFIGQCLNRRIDDIEVVRSESSVWQGYRNNKGAKVNWQFTTKDARTKLTRLYPTLYT